MGVACLDCHVNGHTTAQFHLNPDNPAQHRRFRLDTTSLRGMFNQQIHGSKRSLRSVEDFTEFEQRTAYFNGDPIRPLKKGINILDRIQVSHMAQMQNMFDFPPAPKLTPSGKLDPAKATEKELSGERLFFWQSAMRDMPHAAVLSRPPNARSQARALSGRGAARPDQDVYLARTKGEPAVLARWASSHAEDTVEIFNLVLELKLTPGEKTDLVACMRQLYMRASRKNLTNQAN
jgi:hypothetical protein